MTASRKDIITLPNKHLRQQSKKVGLVTDDIRKLANDMQTATLDWEDSRAHEVGVALAAIQVDKKLKVIIIRNNFEDKSDKTFQVLINPRITRRQGKLVEDFEGCLSVKDIYGKVPRYEKVKARALDLSGKEIRLSAEGFLARVLQHEIDHTKGMLFIDHIKDNPDAFFQLTDEGKLEPIDWSKHVKDNRKLWG
jgi:peptide deformylase